MVNQLAIIVTIAAILILIPVTYFHLAQAQKEQLIPSPPTHYHKAHPAGLNTTSTSNMTGAAGNKTAAHGSSIPTAKPAGILDLLDPR